MTIFNSYVKLPEGISIVFPGDLEDTPPTPAQTAPRTRACCRMDPGGGVQAEEGFTKELRGLGKAMVKTLQDGAPQL